MTDLDALLAGIVADPYNGSRWLIAADWLDDHGEPERAELTRLHRALIATCREPTSHPERGAWHARIVELIDAGVSSCVPQQTLLLPGGVPLIGHFIPPGSFLMGGAEFGDERPIHEVTLTRGFWVGSSPITQEQWFAVAGNNPSGFTGDAQPVENVGWDDAVSFCERLSAVTGHPARLPTEAEWEYACRAGTTTRFPWGDAPAVSRMNYRPGATGNGARVRKYRDATTAVGTFAANLWGLTDLLGNVWEWCADWYDEAYYGRSSRRDPRCDDGERVGRVLRGGSWQSGAAECRSASRHRLEPTARSTAVGFRIVFFLD